MTDSGEPIIPTALDIPVTPSVAKPFPPKYATSRFLAGKAEWVAWIEANRVKSRKAP